MFFLFLVYFARLKGSMYVTYLLYFGYMGVISLGFFLITGKFPYNRILLSYLLISFFLISSVPCPLFSLFYLFLSSSLFFSLSFLLSSFFFLFFFSLVYILFLHLCICMLLYLFIYLFIYLQTSQVVSLPINLIINLFICFIYGIICWFDFQSTWEKFRSSLMCRISVLLFLFFFYLFVCFFNYSFPSFAYFIYHLSIIIYNI